MTVDVNLGFVLVADGQNDKESQFNLNDVQLSAAMNSQADIAFVANARTLTADEFTHTFCFAAGALSATGTLTVPLTHRQFAVDNTLNNSPAHALIVKGATGGTVSVTGGTMALLYCNGTDVKGFG